MLAASPSTSLLTPLVPSSFPLRRHRLAFFRLLRAINVNCFDALLKIPAPQFKLVMDSVVWATKHTTRDIGDLGLK